MAVEAVGKTVLAPSPDGLETHTFATAPEAKARAAFVNEALTWIGTPFRDCAAVKGRAGAVDCAMLLVRSAVDTGLLAPFDPRPYPPRWHLHRDEERFVDIVTGRLGASEVNSPKVGDVVIWQFGRTFSHGAILINRSEVVHAYWASGCTLVSRIDEPLLTHVAVGSKPVPRPVRYFDLWSARG